MMLRKCKLFEKLVNLVAVLNRLAAYLHA